jgi:hypothetical protein
MALAGWLLTAAPVPVELSLLVQFRSIPLALPPKHPVPAWAKNETLLAKSVKKRFLAF